MWGELPKGKIHTVKVVIPSNDLLKESAMTQSLKAV
jgi:hypothetical protein